MDQTIWILIQVNEMYFLPDNIILSKFTEKKYLGKTIFLINKINAIQIMILF